MLQAWLARFASLQKTHNETPAQAPKIAEIDAYFDVKNSLCHYQKQQSCADFYLQKGSNKLDFVLVSQDRLASRFNAI